MFNSHPKISIIGLGYVGLPLAVSLARVHTVLGFDINEARVQELKMFHDLTHEVDSKDLKSSSLHVSCSAEDMKDSDIFIVTVPTPVTPENQPDLTPLERASLSLGAYLKKGAIVVYESTVYPGVTEDFCAPLLEQASGLKSGKDFFLGYSPERINPGDKVHTLDKITKVVAGQTPDVTAYLGKIYGSINDNNVFLARTIKTAEAAKVIENAQRDINIAFINEVTAIFNKLGISIHDVLDAAKTKWNFLPFAPGLVGGHCIGVDPYYLAFLSRQLNHEPEIILAGRKTNENMSHFLVECISENLQKQNHPHNSSILILGLTFKENVPDLRNTKIIDLITALKKQGYNVAVHDPLADPVEAKKYYDIDLHTSLPSHEKYHCIIGAVPHAEYLCLDEKDLSNLLQPEGMIADIKNIWPSHRWPPHILYWSL